MTADHGDDLHADFDTSRWVTTDGDDGRLLLGFNPHVHRGRIGVWSVALRTGTRISAQDVTDASPEARAWIDGFLAGNEPDPEAMFGKEIRHLPDDDPKWARWAAAVAHFRATGHWEGGYWYELRPIDPAVVLVGAAWARRGDEIWLWNGDHWLAPDPQPTWATSGPPGTPCTSRGAHSIVGLSETLGQCEDCGRISQHEDV